MGKKRLYLETYGCQMNVYDSDRIINALDAETTDDPKKADIIIINTCAIRDKADQKAFSSLGKYKHLKKRDPNKIVGIAGCVAQLYGDKLLKRMPHLDFVLGPRAIPRLAELVSDIESEKTRSVETSYDIEELFDVEPHHESGKVTAFVSVQQGCNKKCTYCIVPYVRGSEVNRPLHDILSETANLVRKGVREITFIGQTVNSWRDNGYKFGDLLRAAGDMEGLDRIRFTTSYPRDVTRKMVEAMRDVKKVCRHIHLPVQSGSDSVLRMMKRTYKRDWYLDSIDRLRDAMPDIALSTDIIVGFPGETGGDFDQTMSLLDKVQFDSVFSFKFSPRPGTPAAELTQDDTGSDKSADDRLQELQSFQRDITLSKNIARVGHIEEVLVEGVSRYDETRATGRTSQNRIVNFDGGEEFHGNIVNVKIMEGLSNSLRGELYL